jgi:two-component system, NarL family, response regulator
MRTNTELKKSFADTGKIQRGMDSRADMRCVPMTTGQTLTILVADDHPVVREGLVAMINRQPDMHVIAEAADGREAVEKFLTEHPDIGLLDIRMPVMEGIETISAIREKLANARLVVLSSYETEEDVFRAVEAGAQGYLMKSATKEELVECIRAVCGGRTWIPTDVGSKLAKRINDPNLTDREMDVLGAVAAGKSNKEIGAAFDISEATVKVHVTHILEKLKVTGRTEAINVAVKRGLVRMDQTAGS